MKVLITGGNGNLGRLVAASLESSGTQVISFDLPGTLGAFSKIRHATVLGDIRNHELLKRVLETHQPNAIIHSAKKSCPACPCQTTSQNSDFFGVQH